MSNIIKTNSLYRLMRWRPTDSAGQLAKLDLMARHPGVYPMVMAGGLIVAGLSTVSRAATCQGPASEETLLGTRTLQLKYWQEEAIYRQGHYMIY